MSGGQRGSACLDYSHAAQRMDARVRPGACLLLEAGSHRRADRFRRRERGTIGVRRRFDRLRRLDRLRRSGDARFGGLDRRGRGERRTRRQRDGRIGRSRRRQRDRRGVVSRELHERAHEELLDRGGLRPRAPFRLLWEHHPGHSKRDRASFAAAQQAYESCVPGCRLRGCDHADRAEDGQTLTASGQAFAAQCQSGRCTSVVTTGPTSACLAGGACDPTSSAACNYCDRGGTLQQFCECTTNGAGQGSWSCAGSTACGSTNCGLNGSTCDPRRQTTCEQCDASGARRLCTCVASGSQDVWACNSTASGGCGVDCGARKCLAGEICVQLGRYPGTFMPDAGPPTTTPTCVVVPDACGASQPSCATCIVSAFGCSTPGTCRDLGPQTFECILPGA